MAYERFDGPGTVQDGDDEVLPEAVEQAIEDVKYEKYLDNEARSRLLVLEAQDRAKQLYEEKQAEGHVYTWAQVSHDDAFAMSRNRIMPDIGHLTETPSQPGLPLFYSGKINGVHGDSEAGKSWLMQLVAVQEIQAHRHVLYIDFEDDAGGVYGRLLKLGATETSIREFFHYINPHNKLTVFEQVGYMKLVQMTEPHSLAVIDGVTEAMSLENLTGRDEGEVAKWHALITKPLAGAGWGPTMIDHTPHGETRVIGSQHKRAAITGVSYSLDSVTSFAPGQCGKSVLRVEKDRPGWIRGEAAPGARPQWYGTFVLDATVGQTLQPSIWLWKPITETEDDLFTEVPDDRLMVAICRMLNVCPGASARRIRTDVKGNEHKIISALEWLIDHGYVTTSAGSRNSTIHHLEKAYDPSAHAGVVPATGAQDQGTTQQAPEQGVLE